jgi:flagellar basal body-associated protein FliL
MFDCFKKKKTNYGKIIAITVAVVAGAAAIAFVIYKLIKKYTEDLVYDCDDLLDDCDDCDLAIDEAEEVEEAVEAADAE